MRVIDWVGVLLVLAVGGLGTAFIVQRRRAMMQMRQAPPGATQPKVPTTPVQAPSAPPQPDPKPAPVTNNTTTNNVVNRPQTNELDAGIAGINAGRDVLLGAIKAFSA